MMATLLAVAIWVFIAGLAAGALALIYWVGEDSLPAGALTASLSLPFVAMLAIYAYDEMYNEHPEYHLRKTEWFCSARHTEVVTTYVSNGNNGMMPIVNSYVVCDQYNRKD